MSLNRTLDRLFDEIRREAKRNPAFAARLDAVLQGHQSNRAIDEAVRTEIETPMEGAPTHAPAPPEINPVGLYQRAGADVLRAALEAPDVDEAALRALIEEHNLDPGGDSAAHDAPELVALILDRAARRVERDRKLFEY